jgi:hypothetical protein
LSVLFIWCRENWMKSSLLTLTHSPIDTDTQTYWRGHSNTDINIQSYLHWHNPIDTDTQPYWHWHIALLTWTRSHIGIDTRPYWHWHIALLTWTHNPIDIVTLTYWFWKNALLTLAHGPIDTDTQSYWHRHMTLLTWTRSRIGIDTRPYWHWHTSLLTLTHSPIDMDIAPHFKVIIQEDMDLHCWTWVRTKILYIICYNDVNWNTNTSLARMQSKILLATVHSVVVVVLQSSRTLSMKATNTRVWYIRNSSDAFPCGQQYKTLKSWIFSPACFI